MIALEHLSKSFASPVGRRHILTDVTFELPGGNLALIGRNGAGKSTLLRLIAGTLAPDAGLVRRDCRVSWPMGFSGGLHPALTGAQNARFVARIHGRDTARMVEEVARFAELGRQLHAPVGTYSSGMRARLAFAVSMAVDFDLYLVDEIIGVGDAAFRRKCRAAFEERAERARVIIISHDAGTLRSLCSAAIRLEAGRLTYFPDIGEALAIHEQALSGKAQAA